MEQFLLTLAQYFRFNRQRAYAIGGTVLLGLVGFFLAVTRIFGPSPDYISYDIFFDLVRTEGWNTLTESRFEPGFSVAAVILTKLFSFNAVVYACIVFATMLLKGATIRAYSSSHQIFFAVSVFYLVRYFPLHELTQLRAAVAIALILMGAVLIWQDKFFYGLLICALSLSFHMSVVAVIPALFFTSEKRWKVVLAALGVFAFVLVFSGLVTGYLGNLIKIVEAYQTDGFGDIKPKRFAVQLLVDWFFIFASLLMWKKLSSIMKRIVLLELIGMAVFYGGIDFAVVAHRMREIYSVFWLIFVANGLAHRNTRLLCMGFISVSVVFYSYVFFFSGTFFV